MKTLKHIALLSVLILTVVLSTSAQSNLKKARESKDNLDYADAVGYYQKYFTSNPADISDARDLAECYLLMNDTRNAEEWYGKVVADDYRTADDVLAYARILKTQGRYGDAILQFEHFAALQPSSSADAERWVSECEMAESWMANPTFYDVVNASRFNSEYSDFGLIPFENGYLLTSDRKLAGESYTDEDIYGWTGNPYLKLYLFGGSDKEGYNVPEGLNYSYHNGPGTFNEDTKELFYTRTKMVRVKKDPVNSDPTSWYELAATYDYVMRLEIYSAKFSDGRWLDVQAFKYNNSDKYSIGHPAFSPDGKLLYLVSDMPGGYGDADIYYCELQKDGSWSTPVNAGPTINTSGKEVFPFVAADGSLYFSSDGHPGMGGLDLFVAKGAKNKWSTPENLKYPINSPRDDFSITTDRDGKFGYLASDRTGGRGGDDIYSFAWAPPTKLILSVSTYEKLDDGTLWALDKVNLEATPTVGGQAIELVTDVNGKTYTTASCATSYLIRGQREGYFSNATFVETPTCQTRNDTVFAELVLDRIIINKPIVLENIYYDYNKWDIRPDAAVELNKLVDILVDNPNISIELGSHTDSRGTKTYNEWLSQKRAESAVAYIISKGISPERIVAKGYGENVPVNNCIDGVKCSDESYQLNRRTEFKVTKLN